MGILFSNGNILNDDTKVHDLIIKPLKASEQEKLFIKIYDKKKRLFASGEWNEEGFLNTVTYYNKSGSIKSIAILKNGVLEPKLF